MKEKKRRSCSALQLKRQNWFFFHEWEGLKRKYNKQYKCHPLTDTTTILVCS